MKEYAFTFYIIVEQQYLFISWIFWFILELGIGVSDIWSIPVLHEQCQNSTMWKSLKSPNFLDTITTSTFI